jgi:hypothetical protein
MYFGSSNSSYQSMQADELRRMRQEQAASLRQAGDGMWGGFGGVYGGLSPASGAMNALNSGSDWQSPEATQARHQQNAERMQRTAQAEALGKKTDESTWGTVGGVIGGIGGFIGSGFNPAGAYAGYQVGSNLGKAGSNLYHGEEGRALGQAARAGLSYMGADAKGTFGMPEPLEGGTEAVQAFEAQPYWNQPSYPGIQYQQPQQYWQQDPLLPSHGYGRGMA